MPIVISLVGVGAHGLAILLGQLLGHSSAADGAQLHLALTIVFAFLCAGWWIYAGFLAFAHKHGMLLDFKQALMGTVFSLSVPFFNPSGGRS
jgi:hypothetical protein